MSAAAVLPRFSRIRRRSKSRAERRHIEQVRRAVYERSGGSCELRQSPKCWKVASWDSGHLAHSLHAAENGRKKTADGAVLSAISDGNMQAENPARQKIHLIKKHEWRNNETSRATKH